MKLRNRASLIARNVICALALSFLPAAALTATPASAASCVTPWGSTPESANRATVGALTNVRSGRHACYDRLVLDVSRTAPGYRVRYVSNVYADGSGALVPLRGGAKIEIVALLPAYNSAGAPTYNPANATELTNVAGYRTFRQVAWAGSFEGQSTIGLGVRARLPFRVSIVPGPGLGSRLVIDVAHTW